MMNTKSKVAIYCRLSEEDRNKQHETDDSNSIQNQKSMLIQYVLEQGWEVYNIYSDDDYTGSDRRRPEFNKLLNDAEHRKFDIILCKTQSRFTRELELVEKYIHGLFPIWGIRFISIVDNADTANKGNKKSRQINGLVNEWYLEDLIIDEEAAAVVREVFTLFSQGYGKTAIARMLNDRGIPNPTEYKRLHGLRYKQPTRKNSTLWKYFAISDMLTNEIYIGNMVQGKYGSVSYKTKQNKPRPKEEWYRVEGTHEPIIDRELWDRVQSMVAEKAKPFTVGTIGLFARKARCMNCGYTMRSNKQTDGRHYLQCSNRHVAKDACIGSFISVKKLEQAVISELNKLSQEYLDKDELEQNVEFHSNVKEKKTALETQLATYQKKIEEDAKVIRELYLDKVKGILSENDFLNLSKDFTNDRERLEKLVIETQKQLDVIERKIQTGDNRRQLIEQYTNLEHLDRETVETLIDYILVGKRIPGTRNVPIEIHWNF